MASPVRVAFLDSHADTPRAADRTRPDRQQNDDPNIIADASGRIWESGPDDRTQGAIDRVLGYMRGAQLSPQFSARGNLVDLSLRLSTALRAIVPDPILQDDVNLITAHLVHWMCDYAEHRGVDRMSIQLAPLDLLPDQSPVLSVADNGFQVPIVLGTQSGNIAKQIANPGHPLKLDLKMKAPSMRSQTSPDMVGSGGGGSGMGRGLATPLMFAGEPVQADHMRPLAQRADLEFLRAHAAQLSVVSVSELAAAVAQMIDVQMGGPMPDEPILRTVPALYPTLGISPTSVIVSAPDAPVFAVPAFAVSVGPVAPGASGSEGGMPVRPLPEAPTILTGVLPTFGYNDTPFGPHASSVMPVIAANDPVMRVGRAGDVDNADSLPVLEMNVPGAPSGFVTLLSEALAPPVSPLSVTALVSAAEGAFLPSPVRSVSTDKDSLVSTRFPDLSESYSVPLSMASVSMVVLGSSLLRDEGVPVPPVGFATIVSDVSVVPMVFSSDADFPVQATALNVPSDRAQHPAIYGSPEARGEGAPLALLSPNGPQDVSPSASPIFVHRDVPQGDGPNTVMRPLDNPEGPGIRADNPPPSMVVEAKAPPPDIRPSVEPVRNRLPQDAVPYPSAPPHAPPPPEAPVLDRDEPRRPKIDPHRPTWTPTREGPEPIKDTPPKGIGPCGKAFCDCAKKITLEEVREAQAFDDISKQIKVGENNSSPTWWGKINEGSNTLQTPQEKFNQSAKPGNQADQSLPPQKPQPASAPQTREEDLAALF